jgi:hypothetical protein
MFCVCWITLMSLRIPEAALSGFCSNDYRDPGPEFVAE